MEKTRKLNGKIRVRRTINGYIVTEPGGTEMIATVIEDVASFVAQMMLPFLGMEMLEEREAKFEYSENKKYVEEINIGDKVFIMEDTKFRFGHVKGENGHMIKISCDDGVFVWRPKIDVKKVSDGTKDND